MQRTYQVSACQTSAEHILFLVFLLKVHLVFLAIASSPQLD